MAEYLSSREVARHLRLLPKKTHALVAEGQLPAARLSGKWLFPRELVDRWVARHTNYPPGGALEPLLDRVVVSQGSDDPLLSGVVEGVQEALGAAVATAHVGSLAGLEALAEGRAHLAASHVEEADARPYVRAPTWRIGLFRREQGILLDRRLDFVPLAEERFDLAVPATFLSHPSVARLVELVLDALGAEARREPAGYAFDVLGRVAPFAGEGAAGPAPRSRPPSHAVPSAGRSPPKPHRTREEHR